MGFLSDLSNLYQVAIVQSDDTIYNPPLKAIMVTLDGTLVVEGADNVTHTIVIPAAATGGSFPCYIIGRFRRVLAATSIADANLHGLR